MKHRTDLCVNNVCHLFYWCNLVQHSRLSDYVVGWTKLGLNTGKEIRIFSSLKLPDRL
jgi:hypothetical protein